MATRCLSSELRIAGDVTFGVVGKLQLRARPAVETPPLFVDALGIRLKPVELEARRFPDISQIPCVFFQDHSVVEANRTVGSFSTLPMVTQGTSAFLKLSMT